MVHLIYCLVARVVKGSVVLGEALLKLPLKAIKAMVRKISKAHSLYIQARACDYGSYEQEALLERRSAAMPKGISQGCYNAVKVIGKYALRVAKSPASYVDDASWDYMKRCYELGDSRPAWAPKVYWLGNIKGHTCAIVEAVPEEAEYKTCRILEHEDGTIFGVIRDKARQVVEGWAEFWIGHKHGFDLHTGNYRFRADGSVVFTDPVA